MKRCLRILFLFYVFASVKAAQADTVYNLNATLIDGGTLQGTLTFGTVTVLNFDGSATITGLVVTAQNFTLNEYGFTDFFTKPPQPGNFGGSNGSSPYTEYLRDNSTNFTFVLELPDEIPLQNAPSALCTLSTPCTRSGLGAHQGRLYSYIDDAGVAVQSGSLTAITPEPSTLLLFGTGLMSLVGAGRRSMKKPIHRKEGIK